MTKCSKLNLVLSVATILVLAIPGAAIAGGRKDGGGGGNNAGNTKPSESVSLNYTKIHHDYKPQTDDGTLSTNSKMQTKKAGPNLLKGTAQGKHYSKVSH